MRRRASALLALGACALTGCAGIGGNDAVKQRTTGPELLSKAQVQHYPAGSPARTVFEWWRSIQFDNPVTAARYYSTALGVTPKTLESQLQFGAGAQNLNAKPKLVEVDENGNRATVMVLLQNTVRNPNGRVDTSQTARAFNLVREQGTWKLAENLYLERGARIQKAFARAAQLQAAAKGKTTP